MPRFHQTWLSTTAMVALLAFPLSAQTGAKDQPRFDTWYPYQLIPNLLLYASSGRQTVGAEWEITPVSYSWGINRHVSPWSSFIVVPTSRFSGSIEWNVSLQVYSARVRGSLIGISSHLMTYHPLSDVGELAGLNAGLGVYGSPEGWRLFKVVGLSTAFGMLHFNVKHADRPTSWIGSIEVRIY